jgi:hypothetical protein
VTPIRPERPSGGGCRARLNGPAMWGFPRAVACGAHWSVKEAILDDKNLPLALEPLCIVGHSTPQHLRPAFLNF